MKNLLFWNFIRSPDVRIKYEYMQNILGIQSYRMNSTLVEKQQEKSKEILKPFVR